MFFSATKAASLGQSKDVALGSAAPDWRLKTVERETVALSELRGKVVGPGFLGELVRAVPQTGASL